jgi:hypothetical protein
LAIRPHPPFALPFALCPLPFSIEAVRIDRDFFERKWWGND